MFEKFNGQLRKIFDAIRIVTFWPRCTAVNPSNRAALCEIGLWAFRAEVVILGSAWKDAVPKRVFGQVDQQKGRTIMVGRTRKISLVIGVFAAASLLASHAQAETFTFTSTSEEPTTVGGPTPDGGAVGGAFWTSTSEVTFADGRRSTNTATCISMVQPPRDAIFMTHGVCDGTGPDGDFTVVNGCNWLNEERTENSCVGGLIGKSGRYEGRRGTLTIHSKGNKSTGTGQWYD